MRELSHWPARILMANTNGNANNGQQESLRSVRLNKNNNSARRRLDFGDPEDGEPSKEEFDRRVKEEMRKDMELKKAKWNFDFEKERPLQGQWQWERVVEPPAPTQSGGTVTSSNNPALAGVQQHQENHHHHQQQQQQQQHRGR